MKFPEQIKTLAEKLGLTQKVKDNTMTSAEWKSFKEAYKQEFGTSLEEDNATFEQTQHDAQLGKQVASLFPTAPVVENNDTAADPSGDNEPSGKASQNSSANNPVNSDPDSVLSQIQTLIATNTKQSQQIQTMQSRAAQDAPLGVATIHLSASGPGTDKTHLFGISHPMFSIDKRWNQMAANPRLAGTFGEPSSADQTTFQTEAKSFGLSLANRFNQLHQEGKLNKELLKSTFNFTTSDLADAGLGDQYVVRRQDALIARILSIPSISSLYATRYGIQDRELITNAFFTELTQAFQTGQVFKGGMSLAPEYGHVDDVMIKIQFGSMKEIERMYIGYLNTSGSEAIKWSMIEFALLNMYKQAANEYNKRKVMGIYVKPEKDKPGHAMHGSTGLIFTMIRYYHENKMLLHGDTAFRSYDSANFVSTVKEFVKELLADATAVDGNLDGFEINLNVNHKGWWTENIRTIYGQQMDFTGPDSYMNVVPDTEIRIRWIPNLSQYCFMWLEIPGNIQFLEFLPGEMYAVKMQSLMEEVITWSTWKEGTAAAFVGKNFNSAEDLAANAYALQQIFMNKPSTLLAADATTADAKKNFWFETSANTAEKAITDITGAVRGIAYIIECGNITNATIIAKAGKFAGISAAYTPTKVGDYLMVVLNSDGDGFLEMERCVDGVRSINKVLQPNVPGAR